MGIKEVTNWICRCNYDEAFEGYKEGRKSNIEY